MFTETFSVHINVYAGKRLKFPHHQLPNEIVCLLWYLYVNTGFTDADSSSVPLVLISTSDVVQASLYTVPFPLLLPLLSSSSTVFSLTSETDRECEFIITWTNYILSSLSNCMMQANNIVYLQSFEGNKCQTLQDFLGNMTIISP